MSDVHVSDVLDILKSVPVPRLASGAVSQAFGVIGDAIGSGPVDLSSLLPSVPAPPGAPPSLNDLKDAMDNLTALVTGFLNAGPQPVPIPDPAQVLSLIASAVTRAETALNLQNLAIASGTLDITLNVGSDKGANANTKFTLDIRPTAFERQPGK
jgi:hypothetical protein